MTSTKKTLKEHKVYEVHIQNNSKPSPMGSLNVPDIIEKIASSGKKTRIVGVIANDLSSALMKSESVPIKDYESIVGVTLNDEVFYE